MVTTVAEKPDVAALRKELKTLLRFDAPPDNRMAKKMREDELCHELGVMIGRTRGRRYLMPARGGIDGLL